ncbi:hypothetical protein M431DRAFT_216076 [Trichoderma harzianum CBS 226.95]|uniref:Uncharacterized protein n=1 Tax=Trichoderma harzianum CBS 226.95 TaxID=983964 RepID=A0A2T4A5M1_TRIHA|nr:hypothetical protein M431DRAFT_216076 [Trichoderma harzianum CBS 226.95]PTB52361.1 hypothetical protein M431DRAFT_216076 [Trichoderma harzianum CBS 226.95]
MPNNECREFVAHVSAWRLSTIERFFFFSCFFFLFIDVAILINSSSRCASIHENTITCSAFHLRASSERDKRTFRVYGALGSQKLASIARIGSINLPYKAHFT